MKKEKSLKRLMLQWAAATCVVFSATVGAAETVTIKFSSWLPVSHWHTKEFIIPYLEEIEKVTEGRVKVEILPKMVGTPQGQFDAVRRGLADMSWIIPGYTPGRFPLSEFATMPFMGDSLELGAAFHRIYTEQLARHGEFSGVHLLAIYSIPPGHIATKGKAVRRAEDLQGLKLRSISQATTDVLMRWGAVPINKSASEFYELISTGQIDGSLTIPESIPSFNLVDSLDTYIKAPGGFYTAVHAMVVNPRKWNAISPEDQAAISAISGETLARKAAKAYHDQYEKAYRVMEAAGYSIYTLDDEVVAQLKEAIRPIEAQWVRQAKELGVEDPQAIIDAYRQVDRER